MITFQYQQKLQLLTQQYQTAQQRLEELGKQVGVSHASVSRWESEERTPRIEHLFRISVLLDVDLNWLVNGRKSGAAVAQ